MPRAEDVAAQRPEGGSRVHGQAEGSRVDLAAQAYLQRTAGGLEFLAPPAEGHRLGVQHDGGVEGVFGRRHRDAQVQRPGGLQAPGQRRPLAQQRRQPLGIHRALQLQRVDRLPASLADVGKQRRLPRQVQPGQADAGRVEVQVPAHRVVRRRDAEAGLLDDGQSRAVHRLHVQVAHRHVQAELVDHALTVDLEVQRAGAQPAETIQRQAQKRRKLQPGQVDVREVELRLGRHRLLAAAGSQPQAHRGGGGRRFAVGGGLLQERRDGDAPQGGGPAGEILGVVDADADGAGQPRQSQDGLGLADADPLRSRPGAQGAQVRQAELAIFVDAQEHAWALQIHPGDAVVQQQAQRGHLGAQAGQFQQGVLLGADAHLTDLDAARPTERELADLDGEVQLAGQPGGEAAPDEARRRPQGQKDVGRHQQRARADAQADQPLPQAVLHVVSAASQKHAASRSPGESTPVQACLDVEPEVDDVAVLDEIRLALQADLAGGLGRLHVAGGPEVVVRDRLGADEPASDVRMDLHRPPSPRPCRREWSRRGTRPRPAVRKLTRFSRW